MTATPALRKRITLTAVKSLPANSKVWDTDLKGFGARRQRGTAVSYIVKVMVSGRPKWFTIGRHGQPWTPDTARKQALKILADPASFEKDPVAPIRRFDQIADAFFAEKTELQPRTLVVYKNINKLYLLPAFGKKDIADITQGCVDAKHKRDWAAKPRTANHAVALLSSIMTWAEDKKLIPEGSNPCHKIKRYQENSRERFLTPKELVRLGAALDKAEREGLVGIYAIYAIRLLLLIGARRTEILSLKWSYVDLERGMLFLPMSKRSNGAIKTIVLNDEAIAVLNTIPRQQDNPYVICGNITGAHMVNIHKPWCKIRELARLDGFRIHDLRHSYASFAIDAGGTLPIIGRHLGHKNPKTTARYSHIADQTAKKLTQATGKIISETMKRSE